MVKITHLTDDELSKYDDFDGHEQIIHAQDEASGLNAYIGIHNSNLGPGLGGCRMRAYESSSDAVRDVLRLSRGMTYKNALCGLPLGGGKAVIIGDPRTQKTPELIKAMADAVNSLEGNYVTAEDSGTTEDDMDIMAEGTSFVTGLGSDAGTLGGNPSPHTAYGVFQAVKAASKKAFQTDDISSARIAVQGLGAVGYDLCTYLDKAGVHLIVTDINRAALDKAQEEFQNVEVVATEDIFGVDCDMFAPCALGAQINDQTIPQLKAKVIVGAANNQIHRPHNEEDLAARDILYVPDYAANPGGVIAVGYEYFYRTYKESPFPHELNSDTLRAHIDRVGPTIEQIFLDAEIKGITTGQAADFIAESIFKTGLGGFSSTPKFGSTAG